MKKRILRKFMILFILSLLGMALLSLSGKRPANVGVSGVSLAPIPDSPNAVASQSGNELQRMDAIELNGIAGSQLVAQIKSVIESMPRSKVIEANDKYLYAEFRSLIFRFTDDVEFMVDEKNNRLDFRSASRVGYSDMGVNRKRIAKILAELGLPAH